MVLSAAAASPTSPALSLFIGALEGPGFSLSGLRGHWEAAEARFHLTAEQLVVAGRGFRNLALECGVARLEPSRITCHRGLLYAAEERIPVSFRLRPDTGEFDLNLSPAGERWQARGRVRDGQWKVTVVLRGARIDRLAGLLPSEAPRPGAGTASGTLVLEASEARLRRLEARLQVEEGSFSDPTGLHAGEGLGARVELSWQASTTGGRFRVAVDWHAGGIFWQPLYLPSGVRLEAQGETIAKTVTVSDFRAEVAGVGRLEGQGTYRLDHRVPVAFVLQARRLDLGGLYQRFLAPLAPALQLADTTVAGSADLRLSFSEGRWETGDIVLHDARVEERRLTLEGLNGRIAWHANEPRAGWLRWREGRLLRVPFGPSTVRWQLFSGQARFETLEVPVLDGVLSLQDARVERSTQGWRWQVAGALSAVSMEALCEALGIPPMHGSLSAVVPRITYANALLAVDGALLFRVFDGTAVARNLRVVDPLGRVPRLSADLEMRRLDLDLLTRTFSFGSMEGRVDVDVTGLELVRWKPVRFDARLESSPGDYPRTISQRAVENISALGGAGAAAALQRGFLRFFERFHYRRLGVTCRLAGGVCAMGGVAEAPGGYVIVEGGGIPAITVIGYNRAVGWSELLERLRRITQENVRPVIQ